jgi:hypothetical protein
MVDRPNQLPAARKGEIKSQPPPPPIVVKAVPEPSPWAREVKSQPPPPPIVVQPFPHAGPTREYLLTALPKQRAVPWRFLPQAWVRCSLIALADSRRTGAIRWACATVGLLVWFLTLWSAPPDSGDTIGPTVVINYLALIVSSFAWTALICRRWASRGFLYLAPVWGCRVFLYLAPAVLALVVGVYASLDRYTVRTAAIWNPERSKYVETRSLSVVTKEHILQRNTYKRWTGRPIYREVSVWDATGNLIEGGGGPVAKTGSAHGEWFWIDYQTAARRWEWYWYGERISEGEWHLRSK